MKTFFEEIPSFSEDESNRSPIIFLHAILMSRREWETVAPAIAKKTGRKAYVLDARNHGKSMWSDAMNFDLLTSDLAEFMDERGIERAVVVGSSMGGRTAINFALKHPHRVEAVVVEDMTPRNVKSDSRAFLGNVIDLFLDQLATYPSEMELREAKRQIILYMLPFFHPVYADMAKFEKHLNVDVLPIVREGDTIKFESNINAILAALESNFLVQDLPRRNLVYNGPALFIYGSKAFFKLGEDPTVKALFPNAVIRMVEGASHLMHLDSPEEYVEIVSAFILLRNKQLSKY